MSGPHFTYRAPSEYMVRFVVNTNAGNTTKRMTSTVAGHLDDLYSRIDSAERERLARVAYAVTEGGVDEVDRIVLAHRYRRTGQRELARDVRNAPPSRACVLLECEHGETHCIYLNPAACRGAFSDLQRND